MLAAVAENTDFFKARVNLFVALAPVCKLTTCSSNLVNKMRESDFIEKMMVKFEVLELFPSNGTNNKFFSFMQKIIPEMSNLGIRLISDDDSN